MATRKTAEKADKVEEEVPALAVPKDIAPEVFPKLLKTYTQNGILYKRWQQENGVISDLRG